MAVVLSMLTRVHCYLEFALGTLQFSQARVARAEVVCCNLPYFP
jgi:hypothetical protein